MPLVGKLKPVNQTFCATLSQRIRLAGIFIVGGEEEDQLTEVIQLNGDIGNANCNSPAPIGRKINNAVGGTLNGVPVICGGDEDDSELIVLIFLA